MRGRERRREKEGEEDPSRDEKISVAREGSHGKAYACDRKRECGERKLGEQGRAQKRKEAEERKERDSISFEKPLAISEIDSGEKNTENKEELYSFFYGLIHT